MTDRREPDPESDDATWNRPDTPSPGWGQVPPPSSGQAPPPGWGQPPPPGGPPAGPGRPGPTIGSWTPGPHSGPPYQAQASGPPGTYPGSRPPPPPGAAGWTGPPGVRPTNTLAILALVASFVIGPGGLIMGVIARQQIRQRNEGGDGLALAAIVIGAVGTIGYLLLCIGVLAESPSTY